MRASRAFFLAFHSFCSSSLAFSPLVRRHNEPSWTPARQTQTPSVEASDDGWTPRPTDGPRLDFGSVELFKRDAFSIGTDTCGFVSGYSSLPVTCVKEGAYCTNDGRGAMDCCTGDYAACTSTMITACVDYKASAAGECSGAGPRTLCCWSASPSCYTLMYSTSASPGLTFSILECASPGGIDTLLATPPDLTATATRGSPSSSLATPTTTATSSLVTVTNAASAPPNPPYSYPSASSSLGPGSGGEPTNNSTSTSTLNNTSASTNNTSAVSNTRTSNTTQAATIAGGVIGGVAVIAVAGSAIVWLLACSRRRRRRSEEADDAAAASSSSSSLKMSHSPSASQSFLEYPQPSAAAGGPPPLSPEYNLPDGSFYSYDSRGGVASHPVSGYFSLEGGTTPSTRWSGQGVDGAGNIGVGYPPAVLGVSPLGSPDGGLHVMQPLGMGQSPPLRGEWLGQAPGMVVAEMPAGLSGTDGRVELA